MDIENNQGAPQQNGTPTDEWERDLHPNAMAGQNTGPVSSRQERGIQTAYDRKDVHRSLDGFADDDLKQIPILPEGTRLQQGATYVDLADGNREEFTAMGGMTAEANHVYVPKDEVPYPLWNRLIGEEKPGR